jgi:hypothetical protein
MVLVVRLLAVRLLLVMLLLRYNRCARAGSIAPHFIPLISVPLVHTALASVPTVLACLLASLSHSFRNYYFRTTADAS